MLLEITLAILFAKIMGMVFEKIKQPGVIGEILAGVFLGPCCIGLLSGSTISILGTSLFEFNLDLASPEFKEIAFIGAVFILFIVGLETNLSDLKKTRKAGLGVGIFGVLIPFLFGFLVGTVFGLSLIQSMAIGTIFLATSTTIALRILTDMDLLESHVGLTLRTALVVNDVLAMVFFALVFGVGNSFVLLLQISLFFLVTIVIGFLVVRYMLKKSTKSYSASIALTSGLCICFLFAAFAENMGLTAIIGAFIAGLFIKKTSQAGVVAEYVKTIGYTFFVPLFFVWIGASFNFLAIFQSNQIMSILFFAVVFIVFAMLGNFIGSSFGARITGFKRRDAISVGIGMMPVMGVALIIVSTGIDRGIFGDPSGFLANQVKTATLLLIFTSCFVSPVLFKRSMGFSLFKKNMKTKTKLSSYRHPHCVKCDYPLIFNSRNNKWFCDRCQNFSILPTKRSSGLKLESGERTDLIISYVIGAMTIVMLTFAIQMSVNISFFDKIFAILGIFIGTTLAFLTFQYFRTNRKTTLYKIYRR